MDFITFGAAFILDRISKGWAGYNVMPGEIKSSPIEGVYFMKVTNKGFSKNVLSNKPEVVKRGSALAFVIVFLFAVTGLKEASNAVKHGFSLMLGGGFSNLCDRLLGDGVTDFICFGKQENSKNTTVFNVADFFIFGGAVIVLIAELADSFVQAIKK